MNFSQALAKIRANEEIRAKSTPIAMVAPELKHNPDDTEITKTCAVLGCEESKNLNSDSFFRFPEDPSFRQIWTDLTGRNNWTPTDYSYICVQHFSVDCFECDVHNSVVLNSKAVPSQKLPKHVLEVEYIDEETLDNEYEDDIDCDYDEEEEDQDYDMENDLENNRENEEHLNEDHNMSEDHIEEDHSSEDHIKENHRQSVSNIKHLTNGTYSSSVIYRKIEKPSSSHIDKKTEKPSSSHIDKKIGKLSSSHIDKKIEKPSSSHIDKKIEKPSSSYIDKKIEKPSLSYIDKKTEKPSTSHIDKKLEKPSKNKTNDEENFELLKMFTEVKNMQKQATSLKVKLKTGMGVYKRQSRCLAKMKEDIDMKKKLLIQRRKKKSRVLLSLQDKMREDTNGLVLAMPTRHTDDLKNFALSVYKYSPQAYIYIRNTLRTLLPSTDVLDSWVLSGFEPINVLTNSNMVKVVSEMTDTELSCKVSLS